MQRNLTNVSARTIRVRLAFSIVNFVFPSCPAIRPRRGINNGRDHGDLRTNGTRQVIAVQRLHVFDFERVEVKIVQTKKCDSILQCRSLSNSAGMVHTAYIDIETQCVGFDEISSFLNRANVFRVPRGLYGVLGVLMDDWRMHTRISTHLR